MTINSLGPAPKSEIWFLSKNKVRLRLPPAWTPAILIFGRACFRFYLWLGSESESEYWSVSVKPVCVYIIRTINLLTSLLIIGLVKQGRGNLKLLNSNLKSHKEITMWRAWESLVGIWTFKNKIRCFRWVIE